MAGDEHGRASPIVLVVTDDRVVLERIVEKACPSAGWTLESFSSVSDAAEQIRQDPRRFSVVLLDGKSATEPPVRPSDVEAMFRCARDVPVIVLADGDPEAGLELATRCGRAGASGFFLRSSLDETRFAASMAAALARPVTGPSSTVPPLRLEASDKGPEPAFVSFAPDHPSDNHVCVFALRLRGVSGEAERGSACGELEARQTEWARKLAGGLFTPEGGRILELRYLASSSRDPAGKTMVTVYLVGLGVAQDSDAAEAAARALWGEMESFSRLGQDLYQFWPVEASEDLRFVLRPFEQRSIVDITATAGRLVVPEGASGSVGFKKKALPPGESCVLDLPLLSGTPPRSLRPLLEALAAQRIPLQLTLRLEPRVLTSEERRFLEELRERLSSGRGEPVRIEYRDGGVKALLGAGDATQESILTLLGGLGEHYRTRCFLEAAAPVGRSLQTIAADVLLGGDPRGWILEDLPDPTSETVRSAWGIVDEPSARPTRFEHLHPLSSAWVFLRLPLAGDGAVRGIDIVPLSYGYFPPDLPPSGLKLGEKRTPAGLFPVHQSDRDRLRHTYILGQTGTGKSTLLATLAIQDIEQGRGISVLDPHGDLVEDLLSAVPKKRMDDVVLFDLADVDHPVALNLLEYDRRFPQQKTFLINEMMAIFDNLYDLRQTGGPMFENYMFNAMLLLMQDKEIEATLLDVPKIFIESGFRKGLLDRCQDELVRSFWKQALAAGGEASLANLAPYITSKLNQFVYNDVLRPIIRQARSAIDFRAVMDEGKILLVNLAKGYAGETSSALVGMVLVARIMAAAMSRYDTPRDQRRPHYLYVDEFQRFTSRTVPQMLAEVRKYGLGLILANQNLQQLSEATAHAVLGNVGTMLLFRPGPPDAERIRSYVEPTFSRMDMLGLPNFAIVGRLLVNDAPTTPFLFNTAWRTRPVDSEWGLMVRKRSRRLVDHKATESTPPEAEPSGERREDLEDSRGT